MFKTQNLYQNDEKWKKTSLGHSSETIGGWGCLLTSVTMMLNGMGYNETPETVNEKMKTAGGFQGAFFIPSVLPYVFPNVQYKSMQPCEALPAPVGQIDAAIAAGKPVILQVDWNKQAGIQTHFVLVKEKKGDDYVLYDPYKYGGDGPDKEVLLTKRYKYNGATLETEVSAVLWFDGNIPPSPPEPKTVPVPKDALKLYVIEDDLALRADPSASGYLWKRMTAGTELLSLEDATTTKAKLGQQGQWAKVQDSTGQQGYTAAWYVSDSKEPKPAPPPAAPKPVSSPQRASTPSTTPAPAAPATSTAASAAKVPVPPGAMELLPSEELAFRTQPVIADNTLIRRIPPAEKLISLELVDQTIKKVGVTGQWLNVQDQTGRQGFVAAWYVKYASGTTAQTQVAAAPPAPNAPVTVRTTIELVALRKKPVVDPSTLIEFLPIGTELTIIEPGGVQKIGANNQWINVKGKFGAEGYIAAWFVAS
ncbi:MAG: C39 family peptidase [Anaerolineales bacterium]|nr:C39 family peptidase [Anaerolineales bacterium]